MIEINKIYNEPCLETLRKMNDKSIDCVISSPPYWQLRDYGYDGQWGLEPTFQEYLEHLWEMMDEIYRVLKDEGTCWINLGDTYNSKSKGSGGTTNKTYLKNRQLSENRKIKTNESDKCLLLIPHRFAIGCIDRGWIMRNDIIWAKRNGMPESATDRFTKKHEYFFFMVKSEKYFFDLNSIRDKIKDVSLNRYKYDFKGQEGGNSNNFKGNKSHLISNKYQNLDIEKEHRQGMHSERGLNIIEKRYNLPDKKRFVEFMRKRTNPKILSESTNIHLSKIEHWFRKDEIGFSFPNVEDWNIIKDFVNDWSIEFDEINFMMNDITYESDDINKNFQKGKNPGDVSDFWDVPTKPNKESHYAQYSDSLIKKPILSGCPENGIIYDPFMGSGSTAEAAIRSNRNFIGSEMSEEYFKICNKRINDLLIQQKLF